VRNLPHFQHLLVAAWFTKKKNRETRKKEQSYGEGKVSICV